MSQADSGTERRFYREELLERYGIKKDKYYSLINFLKLNNRKDSDNRAYLTDEQVKLLDELDSYINKNGKMSGFSANNSSDNSGAMVKSATTSIEQSTEDIYVKPSEPTVQFDFNQLMRGAQEIKLRELATPDLLMRGIADQLTEEDLPDDLKEKLAAVREAVNPKWTPASLASKIVAQYRSSRGGS